MHLEEVQQVSDYLRNYILSRIENPSQHDVMLTALSILAYDILHVVSFAHNTDFTELANSLTLTLLKMKEDALNAAN